MLRVRSLLLICIVLFIAPVLFARAQQTEATPDLGQTFTSEDGSLSISYPDGWQASEHPSTNGLVDVNLATSEDALGRTIYLGLSKLQSGEASIHAFIGSPAELIGEIIGIETTDDPVVFLQSYTDHLNTIIKFDLSEAESITINDLPAARIIYHAKNRGDGYLFAIHLGENELALIDVSTAPGELANWDSDLQAIIASLSYTPDATVGQPTALSLTQHFASSDNRFSFDYPEGWAIKPHNSSSNGLDLSVATAPGELTKNPISRDTDKFAPGELRFNVISAERSTIFETAKLSTDSTVVSLMAVYLTALTKTNGRFSAAEALSIGDYPAARTEFIVPDRANGYFLLIDMKTIIVGLTIYYAPGEAALWEPTLQAMIDSVAYTGS